jgi:hypothetical protein
METKRAGIFAGPCDNGSNLRRLFRRHWSETPQPAFRKGREGWGAHMREL